MAAAVKAIIVMVLDDLGYHDLGYSGSLVKTPNLDQLRSEGLLLDNYYVPPICTPSRGSFMTGRYPLALGLQGGLTIQQMQTWGLPLDETTLPQILKQASNGSVATHAVGKWHLGSASWSQTPTFRGFDSFYGYYLGQEDYYFHSVGPGYDLHRDGSPNCGAGCSSVDWGANGTYSTYLIASEAERIIAQHDTSQQLFLYLAWQSVHSPVQAPAQYVAPYQHVFNASIRQVHAGMLAALDEAVGNVTRALASAGLADDSVIVVTTDNGGPVGSLEPCGDCNGALNYPLRGGKHSLWQGGVKGTGFVWSPFLYGTSPANRTYGGLSHMTDWLPTVLAWTGLAGSYTPQPAFPLHGYDLGPSLASCASGQPYSSPRHEAVLNIDPTCQGTAAVVTQDGWKLVLGEPGPPDGWDPAVEVDGTGFVVSRGDFGRGAAPMPCREVWPPTPHVPQLWPLSNTTAQLFNVTADPGEHNDVAQQYPQVVTQLTGLLAQWASQAAWPVQNATQDPAGDSSKHNGTWVPWLP